MPISDFSRAFLSQLNSRAAVATAPERLFPGQHTALLLLPSFHHLLSLYSRSFLAFLSTPEPSAMARPMQRQHTPSLPTMRSTTSSNASTPMQTPGSSTVLLPRQGSTRLMPSYPNSTSYGQRISSGSDKSLLDNQYFVRHFAFDSNSANSYSRRPTDFRVIHPTANASLRIP